MSASVGRLVSAVAVGGMATVGLVGLAVPAVAGEASPRLTVSPGEVGPEGRVLLSGDGCVADGEGGVVFADIGEANKGGSPWTAQAGPDGRWDVLINLPAGQPDGTVQLAAACVLDIADIDYPPVSVRVERVPPLALSATTVAAGGSLVVRGGRCIPDGHVETAVKPVGSVNTVAVAGAPVGDDPNWEATLTIPANVAAGRYRVAAVCREAKAAGDTILFAYREAEFEVTATAPGPKVKAVKATPRYTG